MPQRSQRHKLAVHGAPPVQIVGPQSYTYNVTTTAPPATGEYRTNRAPEDLVTVTTLWLSFTNADAQDIKTEIMTKLVAGRDIEIRHKTYPGVVNQLLVTGPPVDNVTYATIPVSMVGWSMPMIAGPVTIRVLE